MGRTIVSIFRDRVEETPDRDALKRRKDDGTWEPITWRAYGTAVEEAALGLASLGFGSGQAASIMSGNRPEWHYADLAILSLGGISVPIYQTSAIDQVAYILGHAESRFVFCEDEEQLAKVQKSRDELQGLEKAILFDGEGDGDFTVNFEELRAIGRDFAKENKGYFAEKVDSVSEDDLATLVYTSGTTGRPKGAELTHHNIVWTVDAVAKVLPVDDRDRVVSYLPLSHILERLSSHFSQIVNGFQTWFAESTDTLIRDVIDCRPTLFVAVPRVWEKAHQKISEGIEESTGLKHTLAKAAIELGLKQVDADQSGKPLGVWDAIRHKVLDAVVLSKIRSQLGMDSVRIAISGAAPLAPEVIRFFHAIGLRIAEGYGQTEGSGPTTVNPPDKIKIGTVGPVIPGVSVKIADDGEILVRGENVFRGYYKNPEATAEILKDGWLYSGDVGVLDDDGYLTITDRKKDLIITAGGRNISPQELEGQIKMSPLVSQAVVIGDRRKYLTALVTLDDEAVEKWATEKGKKAKTTADLLSDADLEAEIQLAIDKTNELFSRTEGIKKFTILPRDFSIDDGEITPTLKVRRKNVNEKYADEIEAMYAE